MRECLRLIRDQFMQFFEDITPAESATRDWELPMVQEIVDLASGALAEEERTSG